MPQTLGPYELKDTLGAGAMGVTYRARDTRTGDAVALKVIHQPLSDDPVILARIRHEADLAAQLQHPNIAAILDQGEDQGHAYLASELVEGRSLADRLRAEGRLPEAEAARIGLAVAHALNAAWAHHVLHRDLTPANIMLAADGRVCVTDFGLTQAQDATTVTRTIAFIASPPYAAPELDDRRGDTRADLYSLGAIMFQMLIGRVPSARDASTRPARARQRDVTELRRAAPALAPLVGRLLATKPDGRYAEAADLVSALEASGPFATELIDEDVVLRRQPLALALATVAIPFAWFFAWLGRRTRSLSHAVTRVAGACGAVLATMWAAMMTGGAWLLAPLRSFAANRRLREPVAFSAATLAALALLGASGYVAVQAINGSGGGERTADGASVVVEAIGSTRTPRAAARTTPLRASPTAATAPAALSTTAPGRPATTPQRPRLGAIAPAARTGALTPAAAETSPGPESATPPGATETAIPTATPAPSSTPTPIPPTPTPPPPPTATPTQGPITLVSSTSWQVASDGGALGTAQVVCLRRVPTPVPPDCPPGATSWDRDGNGGWAASLAGARWIWAPGIAKDTPASDYAHYIFTQCFDAPATPASGLIEVAVDRGTDVLVNDTFVAWVTGANTATALDITPMLRAGSNCITLSAVNDNACAPDCPYQVNPAGVLARVTVTFPGS